MLAGVVTLMKCRTLIYHIKTSIKNSRQNTSFSFASIMSIVIALFVLGATITILMNLQKILLNVESRMEITLFLYDNIDEVEKLTLKEQIEAWDEVSRVEYVSKDQALLSWKSELGEQANLLEGFTEENNPLPSYFRVNAIKPELVEVIVEKSYKIEAVEKVSFSKPVVEFIEDIATLFRYLGLILVSVLLLVSVMIIGNTIRLSIMARRREISIMKSLGATYGFIRCPFLIEGLFFGVTGALIATALVFAVYKAIFILVLGNTPPPNFSLEFLHLMEVQDIALPVLFALLLTGSLSGIVASGLSLRKNIKR